MDGRVCPIYVRLPSFGEPLQKRIRESQKVKRSFVSPMMAAVYGQIWCGAPDDSVQTRRQIGEESASARVAPRLNFNKEPDSSFKSFWSTKKLVSTAKHIVVLPVSQDRFGKCSRKQG